MYVQNLPTEDDRARAELSDIVKGNTIKIEHVPRSFASARTLARLAAALGVNSLVE